MIKVTFSNRATSRFSSAADAADMWVRGLWTDPWSKEFSNPPREVAGGLRACFTHPEVEAIEAEWDGRKADFVGFFMTPEGKVKTLFFWGDSVSFESAMKGAAAGVPWFTPTERALSLLAS
jgi:hypothetical protein